MKLTGFFASTAARVVGTGLLLALASYGTSAQEDTSTSLSIPQFDSAGNMVRHLKAESGRGGQGRKSHLQRGVVEFFSGEKDMFADIATLEFDEATYDPLTGLLTGSGHVVLHAPRGDIAGNGFQYDLGRNHLSLNSAVTFELIKGAQIKGGEADVDLAQGQAKGTPFILRATVSKGVVVEVDPSVKLDFDRAKAESVTYTGADEKVVLASPVETWTKGEKLATAAPEISFQLGKNYATPFGPAARQRLPASSP